MTAPVSLSRPSTLLGQSTAKRCDCIANGDRRMELHAETCRIFACYECGALTLVGEEHRADCVDRCPHCGSEGSDNDHVAGCPTIGTCAQTEPRIPREQWHFDPPFDEAEVPTRWKDGEGKTHWTWSEWFNEHMRTEHPNQLRTS